MLQTKRIKPAVAVAVTADTEQKDAYVIAVAGKVLPLAAACCKQTEVIEGELIWIDDPRCRRIFEHRGRLWNVCLIMVSTFFWQNAINFGLS